MARSGGLTSTVFDLFVYASGEDRGAWRREAGYSATPAEGGPSSSKAAARGGAWPDVENLYRTLGIASQIIKPRHSWTLSDSDLQKAHLFDPRESVSQKLEVEAKSMGPLATHPRMEVGLNRRPPHPEIWTLDVVGWSGAAAARSAVSRRAGSPNSHSSALASFRSFVNDFLDVARRLGAWEMLVKSLDPDELVAASGQPPRSGR
jgi:hypothetical protein